MLVSGLLSGVDWQQLVDQLIEIERRPLVQVLARQAQVERLKATWNEIRSQVTAVRDAARALQDAALLEHYGVASTDAQVVTASVDGPVVAGSYDVTVLRLAEAHTVASDRFSGAVGAAGTLTLSGDDGAAWLQIDVEAGDTVRAIAAKINAAYDAARAADAGFVGVRATVIDDRLVLTRSATGAQQLRVGGDTALLQALGILEGDGVTFANELRRGADAHLTINGLEVTSASNRVTAVQGLTIELVQADPAKTVTLTVERDRQVVEGKIDAFLAAYNRLVAGLSADTALAGRLQSDATAVNLLASLRSRTAANYEVDGRAVSLAAIGIRTTGTSPSLSFDAATFWQAFDENPALVRELLDEAGSRLESHLDAYVRSNGIIEARTDGLNARLKAMEQSIERLELRLEMRRDNLLRRYRAMETLIAQLSTQSNWLAMQTQNMMALNQRGSGR